MTGSAREPAHGGVLMTDLPFRAGSSRPTGTVTFLFTDIEGSTARWEHRADAMRAALARHDDVLAAVIRDHGGHVVKTTGDGVHAAFSRAPDALAAAVAAQRRLLAESWDAVGGLRVRMALHTGAAEERDGDYYGPPLNRAARLMSAGHGGQILLSQTTYDLVRDAPPAAATLLDLGEHRLKDLIRPERIFQVAAPDLPRSFAPLQTLDRRPHNLPIHPTALLGREDEITRVHARLLREDVRLLTLTGPGGTGKTRLSLQVAADLIDRFADGVFFVALASISDPGLVASTIAQTLSLQADASKPVIESLKEYLARKHMLLVLDNFEQILPAATVVSDLLGAAPGLTVLVTSRAALQVRGEHEYSVPPLAFPDRREAHAPVVLSQYGAVALFIERATAIRPDFTVTNENAPAIAEICHRLDGLPLAIELAAARTRLLAPQAILNRLERRLPLLTGGARDLPARQQTLRNAIAWSYDLLTPEEQTLYRRLAVFVGGCTLEAAEAVCDPDGSLGVEVLDGITSLAAQSIVRQAEGPDGEPRFTMLETIREFGLEQLQASGEEPELRRTHLNYFTVRSEQVEGDLFGARSEATIAHQAVEHDNVRAALSWGLAERSPDSIEGALRLSSAYQFIWFATDQIVEGRRWLEQVLTMDREFLAQQTQRAAATGSPVEGGWSMRPQRQGSCGRHPRVAALNALAALATQVFDPDVVIARTDEAMAIARVVGDTSGLAVALTYRLFHASFRGEHHTVALGEEALAVCRTVNDRWSTWKVLQTLGATMTNLGDYPQARHYFEEALAIAEATGDARGYAQELRYLGQVAFLEGDRRRAAQLFEESASWWEKIKAQRGYQFLLVAWGRLLLAEGDLESAAIRLREGLRRCHAGNDPRTMTSCLDALAGVLTTANSDASTLAPLRAARLLGAAEQMRAEMGTPVMEIDRPTHEQATATTRAAVGDHAFEAAFAEGRTMTRDEAVTLALDETASS